MKKIAGLILLFVCIAMVMMAGCTSSSPSSKSTNNGPSYIIDSYTIDYNGYLTVIGHPVSTHGAYIIGVTTENRDGIKTGDYLLRMPYAEAGQKSQGKLYVGTIYTKIDGVAINLDGIKRVYYTIDGITTS